MYAYLTRGRVFNPIAPRSYPSLVAHPQLVLVPAKQLSILFQIPSTLQPRQQEGVSRRRPCRRRREAFCFVLFLARSSLPSGASFACAVRLELPLLLPRLPHGRRPNALARKSSSRAHSIRFRTTTTTTRPPPARCSNTSPDGRLVVLLGYRSNTK